ncbi:hypothetical protein EXIGLDRAFT_758683 [Exidia glandulosa HHB12029]|uniref:G protein-coupled receptor GPR1/2/3 C-terminal domain-containing protein n=1 Tax=Exidia glandulosa HHB12029 TaxID=1314781 RepID=A0A165R240_EXIGL|nr:hypothetical protein EXIGLDRAFT_758683 [Exidia glandulosa HHB12029]
MSVATAMNDQVLERWTSSRSLDDTSRAVAVFTACVAALSALLVLALLMHILTVGLLPYIRRGSKYSAEGERAFLWRPIGALVTSLLLCNLLQAASGLFQCVWAREGRVHTGSLCTAQAVLILSGDVGVSLFNMLVAVHTFTTVCLHKTWSNLALSMFISFTWTLMIVITLLGPYALETPERGPFYGISNTWCFINNNYSLDRLYLQYIPMVAATVVILVLYVLVFLTIRGTISICGWSVHLTPPNTPTVFGGAFGEIKVHIPSPELATTANRMLWYPAAYIIVILPLLVARICAQRKEHVPKWVWNMALVFLYLTGLVNVVIYTSTRRALSPIHWPRRFSATSTSKLRQGSTDPHLTCKNTSFDPPVFADPFAQTRSHSPYDPSRTSSSSPAPSHDHDRLDPSRQSELEGTLSRPPHDSDIV